jgi:hypothetical protein
VARGVIARAIDYLWEKVPRIDIIYICSNSNIARQNIRRLNVLGDKEVPRSRRISLLPSEIKDLKGRKINFIPLTPGTSFDISSGTGIGDERALLYCMLKDEWDLDGEAPKKVFCSGMKLTNFKRLIKEYPQKHSIDPHLKAWFLSLLQDHIDEEVGNSGISLRNKVKKLSKAFSVTGLNAARKREIERESNKCISELRSLLVRSCLKALKPHLIILDEFQRFKHLMYGDEGEDESTISARKLAQELFSYADKNSEARVLLLSATPYKMYTTADEAGLEDHYKDFLNTLEFLVQDPEAVRECEGILRDYRQEIFRIDDKDLTRPMQLKEALETQLRRVMVRTERLAASEDRNGMLIEISDGSAKLKPEDLTAYCGLQKVADYLGCRDSLEYWKSSPYPLNFMDEYELKNAFNRACIDNGQEIGVILSEADGLLLPWKYVEAYGKIDPGNARLRSLFSGTVGAEAWKLLWIPPSLLYYDLGGPFANPALKKFTKKLVFSSWRMVPRMIASLTSYEAERKMIRLFDPTIRNSLHSRKRLRPLLKLAKSDGDERLAGMSVLGIIYPSMTLAKACDPLMMATPSPPSMKKAVTRARVEIERLLVPLTGSSPKHGLEDEDWYWAAPILLDMHYHRSIASRLLCGKDLKDAWTGEEIVGDDEDDEGPKRWKQAIKAVIALVEGEGRPKRPPRDLSLILAKMAIAGPGTACLRALARVTGGLDKPIDEIWISAARMSRPFIHLFNLPTSIALLRGLYARDPHINLPYWQQVLNYCLEGGLQAVLDEYTHFLKGMCLAG